MSKALSDVWHKTGYLEIVDSKFLDVCEYREVAQCMFVAEQFGGELVIMPQADPESLDERKQTELV